MTNREFYVSVGSAHISDEIDAFCAEAIAKLDGKNEARKVQVADKRDSEYAPLVKAMVEFLANQTEPVKASVIAKALDVSTSKVPHIAKRIDGIVISDIKEKGSRAVKGYALA